MYGFEIIPWTKQEITQFDVQTRMLLIATCNHHPFSTAEWLCLPHSCGGLSLISVENLCCRKLVALACCSTDAIISRAVEYFISVAVLFDYTCCGSIHNVFCEKW